MIEYFEGDIEQLREELVTLLWRLKSEGNMIVGISAPAKGNTLLNYCRIGPELLDYLTEISPYKIGKYSPGMHIPVVHDDVLIQDQPQYALLLACNFKLNIVKKIKEIGYKGKIIVPYPELKIEE